MEDKLLTLKEVMVILQFKNIASINRYIAQGRLPVVKLSRSKRFIREQDLNDFIKANTGVFK
jgi:hypothetical protein